MANNGRKITHKGRPFLNPRGTMHSRRAVKNFDARPKSHRNAQGIVHDRIERGHTAVFDTGAQKSMIGRDGWEMIKHHDTCIYQLQAAP